MPPVTAISHDTKAPLPPANTPSTFPWTLFLAEVPAPPAPHSFTLILDTPFGMINEDEPITVYDTDVAKVLGKQDEASDEELLDSRILEIEDGVADGALLGKIVIGMEDEVTDGALMG